jgi:hypothetical protein
MRGELRSSPQALSGELAACAGDVEHELEVAPDALGVGAHSPSMREAHDYVNIFDQNYRNLVVSGLGRSRYLTDMTCADVP